MTAEGDACAVLEALLADEATMRRFGWVRSPRGPIGEHCPPGGQRTLWAEELVELRRLIARDEVYRSGKVGDRLAAVEGYLREHGQCEECGYPIDRSAPYPGRAPRKPTP